MGPMLEISHRTKDGGKAYSVQIPQFGLGVFLAPADDQPAFGIFAALTDGSVLELPALEQDCAGTWG